MLYQYFKFVLLPLVALEMRAAMAGKTPSFASDSMWTRQARARAGRRARHDAEIVRRRSPATTQRDHLIAATLYSQMLYQLSYSQLCPPLRRFTFQGCYLRFQNS